MGCVSGRVSEVPPCPIPQPGVPDEFSEIVSSGLFPETVMWVGSIHRYCMSILEAS